VADGRSGVETVTIEHTSGGDPRRSIELLWGIEDQRPRRGPKPRLTVDRIAQAATQIADAEGLAALSMRRVAEELGIAPMSLYTYVPSKAELADVMIDRAYGEAAGPQTLQGGWRNRLEQVARANREMYTRHPWMLQVGTSRPALGPNAIAKYEYELSAVSNIGLSDVEMDSVITLISQFVQGAMRNAVEAAEVQRRTGMSDAQWWAAFAPLLAEVVDSNRFPIASRVGTAAGQAHGSAFDPAHAFEFGLARVLDGIEAFVRSRQRSARPPRR
jgi:AcrR family transcriptional regulator